MIIADIVSQETVGAGVVVLAVLRGDVPFEFSEFLLESI